MKLFNLVSLIALWPLVAYGIPTHRLPTMFLDAGPLPIPQAERALALQERMLSKTTVLECTAASPGTAPVATPSMLAQAATFENSTTLASPSVTVAGNSTTSNLNSIASSGIPTLTPSPVPVPNTGDNFEVYSHYITLYSAGGVSSQVIALENNEDFLIDSTSTITAIQSASQVRCTFFGTQGIALIIEPGTWGPVPVGPPQVIKKGRCAKKEAVPVAGAGTGNSTVPAHTRIRK